MTANGEFGLTSSQREALALAFESGYYDIPADVTLDSLSEMLGITSQALSERLNRGTKKLIEATLIETN
jgi:predicted DNA binding protein